jgi:ribosomal protein S6
MEKEKSTEENPPIVEDKKPAEGEAETSELRIYEASYLLLPFITEEDIPKEVSRVKDAVSVSGGTVFSEEEPKLIKLAYPMSKIIANKNTQFDNAYFGWVKFESEPESMAKVKKALENNENVLRFLILKTTKESVSVRKPFSFAVKSKPISTPGQKEEAKSEASQEINEAELDKTIEDLVIE